MANAWFKFIFRFASFFVAIGGIIAFMPLFLVRYWWVALGAFMPFYGLALYHRAWTPYIWWWGAVAVLTASFIGTAVKIRNFPNG